MTDKLPQNSAVRSGRRRWWLTFSLRAMVMVLVAVSLGCGWVGCQMQTLRDRNRVIGDLQSKGVAFRFNYLGDPEPWEDREPHTAQLRGTLRGTIAAMTDVEYRYPVERIMFVKPETYGILDSDLPPVTDDDLAMVRFFPETIAMELELDPISDSGLAHIRVLPKLKFLQLVGQQVTNDSLKHLPDHSELESLHLRGTAVTDKGVARLPTLPNLQSLDVSLTGVTGRTLSYLHRWPKLRDVLLEGTAITDASLLNLAKL